MRCLFVFTSEYILNVGMHNIEKWQIQIEKKKKRKIVVKMNGV